MDLPFDTEHEATKLAQVREREEEDVAQVLSDKYGMSYVDLSLKEIDGDALRIIPEEQARLAEVAAFAKIAKTLSLAIHNPNNPAFAKIVEDLTARGYLLQEFLVSKKSLDKVLARYSSLSLSVASKAGVFVITPEAL